jgi:hypothetical protein
VYVCRSEDFILKTNKIAGLGGFEFVFLGILSKLIVQ